MFLKFTYISWGSKYGEWADRAWALMRNEIPYGSRFRLKGNCIAKEILSAVLPEKPLEH
jgi:hypothetical protein